MGIMLPRIIAFFRSFSCPRISFLSSGIEVKPRRENMITPIGRKKFVVWIGVRLDRFIDGANLMKMPKTIRIIAMTPHVSIFLRPFSPSRRRSVMISQNAIPKKIGETLGAISADRDSPSPMM